MDEHELFRAGLRAALDESDTLDFAGEAATGAEAEDALSFLTPAADVVLLDLERSDDRGVDALRGIASGTEPPPGVLVVSAAEDDDLVVAALRAGARGYMLKSSSQRELRWAVHIVAGGGAVFSPEIAARLGAYFSAVHELPSRAAFPELTNRQREILDLIARGYDNRRIARELVLAEKTVRNHISQLFTKLQVADRTAAAVRAKDAGLGL
ncbi:LuxR C-terminal-related transcriptional regulator [Spirillospora sp. CA-294931]|uniref:LuxR C-terminal-related transcriptional regulator n=1 Tax=Spirillospora sp. CA-294931 TaxID=3240042 RepID=UPI003D8FB7E5